MDTFCCKTSHDRGIMIASDGIMLLASLARYITLRHIKIEILSLFGQLTNKRHLYVTPLGHGYFSHCIIKRITKPLTY